MFTASTFKVENCVTCKSRKGDKVILHGLYCFHTPCMLPMQFTSNGWKDLAAWKKEIKKEGRKGRRKEGKTDLKVDDVDQSLMLPGWRIRVEIRLHEQSSIKRRPLRCDREKNLGDCCMRYTSKSPFYSDIQFNPVMIRLQDCYKCQEMSYKYFCRTR